MAAFCKAEYNNDAPEEAAETNRNTLSSAAANNNTRSLRLKKPKESGIIYLSYIPPYFTVRRVREIFSKFDAIGRIFLQPERFKPDGKKRGKVFTEGWVEFSDKRKAKRTANLLNNMPIGGKKRSKWHDMLWNIKYLPKFKWVHLNERLAYEKAVHMQRMRTEISQAKRETNFFAQSVEQKKKLENIKETVQAKGGNWEEKDFSVPQRPTDDEIRKTKLQKRDKSKRKRKSKSVTLKTDQLLQNIFA